MAGATLFVSNAAPAQPGGSNVLHIIVPFAAGGVQDILARSISNELGTLLGQTVIVENKPGAGGTVGTGQVAKAPADGKTVVMAAASHLIAPHLYSKLAHDSSKDFVPAAYIGTASYVLMIPASVPATTAADFIKYAKANPGKLNYASAGAPGHRNAGAVQHRIHQVAGTGSRQGRADRQAVRREAGVMSRHLRVDPSAPAWSRLRGPR